jgi:L-asparaginase II
MLLKKILLETENIVNAPYLPIITLNRGKTVESIHFGAFTIVDSHGKLIASHGYPETITFMRSSSKPFQALPLVESGGAKHWEFTPKEIAITCASHAGTDEHAQTLEDLQTKIGITQNHLQCGVHPPIDADTAKALLLKGEGPTPNRHNCSGKHTGMLAFAQYNNQPLANYLDQEHPLQKEILHTLCDMCHIKPEQVSIGIDGCSAPNFAIPLRNAAFGFARLVDPWELSPKRAKACDQISTAMTSYPEMVAGPGKFDTRLMASTAGKIVAKGGAEGYQALGIKPGVLGPGSPGLGIAIKISDGDPRGRARAAVALQILTQLGALISSEEQSLADLGPSFMIYNWRQILVGKALPTFDIDISNLPYLHASDLYE